MKDKSLVLLSAGLDSTVNLFKAHQETQVELVLTFDYGQRAARREVACSQNLCKQLGLEHQVVELPWFKDFTKTSLVDRTVQVPDGAQVSIDDLSISNQTAQQVWVPNRNGIFLNIGAGFAEGRGAKWVIPGFNGEEAATFPDNTPEFLTALDRSFSYSTSTQVTTRCYTTQLSKTEIVRLGRELAVPFDQIWPCYHANETWCGRCESCQRYHRAMKEA